VLPVPEPGFQYQMDVRSHASETSNSTARATLFVSPSVVLAPFVDGHRRYVGIGYLANHNVNATGNVPAVVFNSCKRSFKRS
jgi:hypothetical protein